MKVRKLRFSRNERGESVVNKLPAHAVAEKDERFVIPGLGVRREVAELSEQALRYETRSFGRAASSEVGENVSEKDADEIVERPAEFPCQGCQGKGGQVRCATQAFIQALLQVSKPARRSHAHKVAIGDLKATHKNILLLSATCGDCKLGPEALVVGEVVGAEREFGALGVVGDGGLKKKREVVAEVVRREVLETNRGGVSGYGPGGPGDQSAA
jgi:hypothetical protein